MTVKTKVPPLSSRNGAQQAVKKLDIACGQNKHPGFKGIDIAGDADIIWDLNEIPWPIKTSCVQEVFCSHYVEHIPHWRPGWEADGWFRFFDELYRVMKDGAEAVFIHPYSRNDRAFWDPTHVRFIHEMTWNYLSKEWRDGNGLDHYNVTCDFPEPIINADVMGDFASRNHEAQNFSRAHYFNVLGDLVVRIKARK